MFFFLQNNKEIVEIKFSVPLEVYQARGFCFNAELVPQQILNPA